MKHREQIVLLLIISVACVWPPVVRAEWAILSWAELPARKHAVARTNPEESTEFFHVFSFDQKLDAESQWPAVQGVLREGDLIAYRMEKWDARRDIFLKGHFNKVGYRLFRYGHLALVVRDPEDQNALRLFSSQAFVGPNIRETTDALKHYSWDVYRLNRWDRVDKAHLYEFIRLARDKGEKWYGYDFSGMFGLWNSNLRPVNPGDIGRDYICSTIIPAALHYAGLELHAHRRHGIADIVTPLQVVTSSGRIKTSQAAGDTERFTSLRPVSLESEINVGGDHE